MQVTSSGSVRVDLVGGTLDLEPINLILPNVVTLNVATSLKAEVCIEEVSSNTIIINSKDYNKDYVFSFDEITDENLYYKNYFKEMSFVLQILDLFNIRKGVKLSLKSGAPAGSGLGGSSAMGMTLYKALSKLKKQELSVLDAVLKVKSIEGRILNQGVPGYQDYFPAMLGGVLCLRGKPGKIEFEQIYTKELKAFLEDHITLVYSGISRNSGINNWDVYKKFFDGVQETRDGLSRIAEISFQTYEAIKDKKFEKILDLIGEEGNIRKALAANIVPNEVQFLFQKLKNDKLVKGLKMCGAGGGGCFILTHVKEHKDSLMKVLEDAKYQVLDFRIEDPI